MAIKKVCEKIILIIITISILLSFIASPVANAGLGLKEGEFYYSGTTKGTYVVSEGIFSWLIDNLGKIADWIFGLCTMGVRMVFVGWTALIEKLLTWSVEQAGGISNNGGLVVDSTDVTSIGDSSGNLTVQAIVYNRVPLFDINFFDLEVDRTVSPTGQILRCEGCKKPCEECCGITKDNVPTDKNIKTSCANCKEEGCNECSNCEQYLANWRAEEPLVVKIREFVAMWYSIIRLLSLVAMLIVLIGIGIKMALSTVASEKAVYKRMFADWIVGIIILFAMHYLMYFIIIINETLVETVQETANSINKSQIQFVNAGNSVKNDEGEDEQIVADDEIEISIYEEIRSRAYDAKLSVGLSGMIMYITLVYFAIRYSIIYLKRYLTVIVLALMAPPLGVAYALQRAMTGKSSSLKTWMNEFVMTVIIQIVHALVYAVFISTALALSLESVAGMIVALIFMNFALKTEKMFRQIFKMGEGDSLAGSVAEAGDAEKIHSTAKAVAGTVMAAKPIANVMMNTPLAKGVKGVGKLGLAGGAAVANKIVNRKSSEENENTVDQTKREDTSTLDQSEGDVTPPSGNVDSPGVSTEVASGSSEGKTIMEEQEEQALIEEGGDSLRTKFAEGVRTLNNPKATPAQKEQARKDMDNYVKYQKIMNPKGGKRKVSSDAVPTIASVAGAHFKRAVNIDNHFQVTADGRGSALTQGFKSLFGTTHRDPHTGKQVYDGNGYFSQFNMANLLGISNEDKKFLKEEALAPLKTGLGFVSFMAGMGTLVASPTLGAIGMGYGASKFGKVYKQIKGPSTKYKGKYGKAKFPAQTVQNMHKQLLKNAYKEIHNSQKNLDRDMIDKVKESRPELYDAIMKDLKMAKPYAGLNVSSHVSFNYLDKKFGATIGAEEKGHTDSTVVPKKWSRTPELFSSAGSTANMGIIDRYLLQRAEKETAAYQKEGAGLLKIAHEQEAELMMRKQDREMLLSTEKLPDETDKEHNQRISKLYEELSEACKSMGYELLKDNKIEKKKFVQSGMLKDDRKTKTDDIEDAIDSVVQDIVYNTSGNISEIKSEEAIRLINEKLQDSKILGRDESIVDLFTGGENTVKKLYEDKAQIANNQMQALVETGRKKKSNSLGTAIGNLESALENFSIAQDKLFESDSTKKDKKVISKETEDTVNEIRKQLILERGTKNLDGAKLLRSIEEKRKAKKTGTSNSINSKENKKDKKKAQKDFNEAEKNAIKALDEYIKAMDDIPTPIEDKETIKDIVVEKTISNSKDKLKKSHDKIRKVLQSKEFDESTVKELIDGTEGKVDEVKRKTKVVVDGETIEFNSAESKTLELLFKKMKEEVVFNEYTKNVLDLKDSSKTKEAKKKMHTEHVNYLTAELESLNAVDNITNEYGKYGLNETQARNMVDGYSISDTVKDLVEKAKMQDYMGDTNVTRGIDIKGKDFDNLDSKEKQKMKTNLLEFLDKGLRSEVDAAKLAKEKYEKANEKYIAANKKAILSGKVDISTQLDNLLG